MLECEEKTKRSTLSKGMPSKSFLELRSAILSLVFMWTSASSSRPMDEWVRSTTELAANWSMCERRGACEKSAEGERYLPLAEVLCAINSSYRWSPSASACVELVKVFILATAQENLCDRRENKLDCSIPFCGCTCGACAEMLNAIAGSICKCGATNVEDETTLFMRDEKWATRTDSHSAFLPWSGYYCQHKSRLTTPLIAACQQHNPHTSSQHLISFLIQCGSEVNRCGAGGEVPLNELIWRLRTKDDAEQSLDLVGCFFAAKADANARDRLGRTPLLVACQHPSPSLNLVHLLVKNGGDPTVGCLASASERKVEIEDSQNPAKYYDTFRRKEGDKPKGCARVVWPSFANSDFLFPLQLLLRGLANGGGGVNSRELRILSDLITKGEVILSEKQRIGVAGSTGAAGDADDGQRTLYIRPHHEGKIIVSEKSTFINIVDSLGETALFAACACSDPSIEIVRLLLSLGADPCIACRTKGGLCRYALHVSLTKARNCCDFIDAFLNLKDNNAANRLFPINTRDSKGATPLSIVCDSPSRHKAAGAMKLLSYGADPSIPDAMGRLPFIEFFRTLVEPRVEESIRQFVARGADIDAVDLNGFTALIVAAEACRSAAHVKALLSLGASVDKGGRWRDIPRLYPNPTAVNAPTQSGYGPTRGADQQPKGRKPFFERDSYARMGSASEFYKNAAGGAHANTSTVEAPQILRLLVDEGGLCFDWGNEENDEGNDLLQTLRCGELRASAI